MKARGLLLLAVTPLCLACTEATSEGGIAALEEPIPLDGGPARTSSPGIELLPLGQDAELNARVAALDLDQDGRQEVVVISAQGVAVVRIDDTDRRFRVWEGAARGGATAVASGDVDGDGALDLVVGWGVHRDHRSAKAQLVAYRTRGAPRGGLLEETILVPSTSRAQFSSIQIGPLEKDGPVGILYAHYSSKYRVRTAFTTLRDGEWSDRELAEIRMGAEVAMGRLGDGAESPIRLFVGRPYGEETKSAGDVFQLLANGERQPLPSLRGVRSLGVFSLGNPDAPLRRVCYGDGWHWRYKAEGEGRITCVHFGEDEAAPPTAELVANTSEYSIGVIASGDLDGDGNQELLGLGAQGFYAIRPEAPDANGEISWSVDRVGPGASHFATLDVDGRGGSEVAMAGENPVLLRLR